jgi:transposase
LSGALCVGKSADIIAMTLALDTLPDDAESLKALIARLAAQCGQLEHEQAEWRQEKAALAAEVERLEANNARLDHIVMVLRRGRFGRSSERLTEEHINLALEDVETGIAAEDAKAEKQSEAAKRQGTKGRRANRGHLPAHLPREEVVIEPGSTVCPCGCALHVIGEDVSERLDRIPARLRVIVTRRPKYACRACTDGVTQAPAPARLIEGGMPTEGLVADVLVSKYAWHLPLYRQAQILETEGISIDRSTLANWVGFAAFELAPLHERLVALLKSSGKLFADETRCPVLDPGRRRTKTGWLWALARDDRPWGGTAPPAVAYLYAPGRGAEHAVRHLAGFRGVLQVDGYTAYKALTDPKRVGGPLTLAFCWAHWRRRFYEIAKGGNAPIAEEALVRIGRLYEIEADIRGRSADERRAERRARSKSIVDDLKPWLEQQLRRVSRGATIAKDIRYGLGHWDGLTRFLDDGRIELDSNTVERSIRPIALNRKNALFAGSDEGGANWAIIASLVETCKLNDVNPHAWLTDTLTRLINRWPASRIDELMPWHYAKADAQTVNV